MSAESLERHGPAIGPWQSAYMDLRADPSDFLAALRVDIDLNHAAQIKPAPEVTGLSNVLLTAIERGIHPRATPEQKLLAAALKLTLLD